MPLSFAPSCLLRLRTQHSAFPVAQASIPGVSLHPSLPHPRGSPRQTISALLCRSSQNAPLFPDSPSCSELSPPLTWLLQRLYLVHRFLRISSHLLPTRDPADSHVGTGHPPEWRPAPPATGRGAVPCLLPSPPMGLSWESRLPPQMRGPQPPGEWRAPALPSDLGPEVTCSGGLP